MSEENNKTNSQGFIPEENPEPIKQNNKEEKFRSYPEVMELLKNKTKWHKRQIFFDIILVLFIIGLGIWMFKEVEFIKIMGSNVCNLCEIQNNATCIKYWLP